MPVYNKKYIRAKVKEFHYVIKIDICGNKISKEGVHDTCKTCITIDCVMRIEKKNYSQIINFYL